jgi:hypothetical protein
MSLQTGMKQMNSIVKVAPIVVTTLTAIFALFATGTSIRAGEIRFWEMPKGCSWTEKYSNGNEWVSTFVGKRNGAFRVVTRNKVGSRERISTTDYNESGLMTRRVWAGNKWESFEPHSCFGVVGKCNYTYRNADGEEFEISSKTSALGNSVFRVDASSSKTGKFPVDTVRTTHFGLQLSSENANFSSTMTELRSCNLPIS